MKNLIKVERTRLEISQSELADRVGVTRQTIYAIEKGKFTPSVILAFKIAKTLNADINYLFTLEDSD